MARARVVPKQGFAASSDGFAKNQLASALDQTRREVNTQPFASGLWLRGIEIAAMSTKQTQHNLGHTPSGYILTKQLGAGGVYQFAADSESITFANPSAGTVTVDAWVF